MNEILYKYIAALDYAEKTLLVLLVLSNCVSLCSFTTVIGTSVGIASASISHAFLISRGIIKINKNWKEK